MLNHRTATRRGNDYSGGHLPTAGATAAAFGDLSEPCVATATASAGPGGRILAMPRLPSPSTPPALPPSTVERRGVARRGLQTLALGAVVAVVLSLVFHQSYATTLVYSECISIACWVGIDGGRALAARWVHRHAPPDAPGTRWPGWGWMMAVVVVGTVGGATTGHSIADLLVGGGKHDYLSSLRNLLSLLAIALVPGVAATYYFWSRGNLQALQTRAESAQRQAAEHQLRLLESQLEPHMLFNTLANLRVLIGIDPARAQAMLDRLIAFLRATLNASRVGQHPLSAEFARVEDYLALMKIRMGNRLQDELSLPPALADRPVPPLLLQPLVENAIKHGLEPHVDGGRLRVSAELAGGQLVLRVRDTGAGLPPPGAPANPDSSGFGLNQVRDRLATLYGDAASLSLEPAGDGQGGTLATVRLPAPDAA